MSKYDAQIKEACEKFAALLDALSSTDIARRQASIRLRRSRLSPSIAPPSFILLIILVGIFFFRRHLRRFALRDIPADRAARQLYHDLIGNL